MINQRVSCLCAVLATMILAVPAVAASDPWTQGQLMTPEELAKELSSTEAAKPTLISLTFRVAYQSGHIPGSLHFGPGRDPKTIEDLKEWAKSVPKNKKVVLYCGCCPWDHCPNVRPAFQALKEMGLTQLRVVKIPNNLGTDWADKGYPIDRGR